LLAADRRQEAVRHRDLLISSVREAGALALKAFRGEQKSWLKQGGSPVSEADVAVDALLHRRLRPATPGFGWLSEETLDDPARLAAPFVWVVDPIDGTRAYLAGKPEWVVSVALVTEGRPILAAVYAPVADEFFLATMGEGATLNGSAITASTTGGLAQARVAGPQSIIAGLAAGEPGIISLPRVPSLALRITRVAQGTVDVAFASGNSHDWDLAAADLLVHEAGGAVTTFTGEPVIYNRPEPVHEALVAAGRTRHAGLIGLNRTGAIRLG
jgi:myo-inositol-1(or 4)-monophosphatase